MDTKSDYYEKYVDYIIEKWMDKETVKQYKMEKEKKHNVYRDERGRLNKGALLAKKDSCNETAILLRYYSGMTVKEIVECRGCSKSTVYNVIKRIKEK